MGRGGARPGSGRKPSFATQLKKIALAELNGQAEISMAKLVYLRDHAETEGVQFAAAKEIKDTAWGKPSQAITGKDGGPLTVNVVNYGNKRPV